MGSGSPLAGLHVLVVEDEAFLAFELVDDLQAVGAVPLGPVPTVGKALSLIETGSRIDAVLLNIMLHREMSFPVAEELQKRGIPFVFVTASAESTTGRFPKVPVHPKPTNMPKLVRILAAVVAEHDRP